MPNSSIAAAKAWQLDQKGNLFFLIIIIIINPPSDPDRKRAASAAAPAPAPARFNKSKVAKVDRLIIPQYLWETPDGQVIKVPDFCGDESDYPGVPIGRSRNGVSFDSWAECVQDGTLLPW